MRSENAKSKYVRLEVRVMSKRLLLLSAVVFALVSCGVGTKCFAEDGSEQLERADDLRDARNYGEAEAIYKDVAEDYAGTQFGLRRRDTNWSGKGTRWWRFRRQVGSARCTSERIIGRTARAGAR